MHLIIISIIIIISLFTFARFSSSDTDLSQPKLNIHYYDKITYYKNPKLSKYNLYNLQLHPKS